MSEIKIREATEADAEAIWEINLRAWPGCAIAELSEQRHGVLNGRRWTEHMARAVAEHMQRKDVATFVAELDGKVIGYANAQMSAEGPTETASIGYNAVEPDYRGRGAGTALVKHAIDFLGGRGARVLTVMTLAADEPARRIYGRLGFKELTRLIYYSMEP